MIKDNFLNQKIGILGGGQLGKMIAQAASKLNLNLHILDKSRDYPAGFVTANFHLGDFKNYDDVMDFGANMDIITIEIEAVNTDALKALQAQGKTIYPKPENIELIKDKGVQKAFYTAHEIPTSTYTLYENASAIREDIATGKLSLPFVQKLRKDGYDGRGVQVVKTEQDLEQLFTQPSLVEDLVKIDKELAIIVARTPSGKTITYDCVEMVFHPTANLLEYQLAPAKISKDIAVKAKQIALDIVTKMDFVGLLAVELFLTNSGEILVNEVAPRPHNSGHHTIEACACSQYEQLLRAILDWPLGDTELRSPNAMLNVLGAPEGTGEAGYLGLQECLSTADTHIHLYGKKQSKSFRKMGHITILAHTEEELMTKVNFVKKHFKTTVL